MRSIACLFLALAGTACADASSQGTREDAASFEGRYAPVRVVQLEQTDEHYIGTVFAVGTWDDTFVLLDGVEGNAKLYDRDGSLRSVLGRPGDGPGEFRNPAAVLQVDGSVAVRDNRHHRLMFFEAGGAVQREWRFALSGGRGMADAPNGDLILVGTPDSEVRALNDGISRPFHVFSRTGEYRYSFGSAQNDYGSIRRNVESEHVIRVGRHIVTSTRSSDTVQVWRAGSSEPVRSFTLGEGFYRAPEWPQARPADMRAWIRRQMWLHGMLPLTDSTLMAWFVTTRGDADAEAAVDPASAPEAEWWYVEAHIDGHVESVTRGTGDVPVAAGTDTLWTLRWQPDASVDLVARSLGRGK